MTLFAHKKFFTTLALLGMLTACQEETKTTTYTTAPPPPGSFSETYTASLTIGEVAELGINTATMTYTYKVLLSSYGLSGRTGSGRITSQNTNGSFNLEASPDGIINGGIIYAVQNGEISGYVNAKFSTLAADVPIMGTSAPITAAADLAGTYNYVSFSCPTPSNGNYQAPTSGCLSDYGTLQINANNTYTRCSKQDLVTTPCATQTSGTLTIAQSQGAFTTTLAGVFNFTANVSPVNTAWIFGYTAANGKKVAIIDFNDASVGGYGYGQAVLSAQSNVAATDIAGNYALYNLIDGAKTTSLQGTSYTSNLSVGSTTGSINFNSPWTGMINWADSGGLVSGYAVIAGTGIHTAQMEVAPVYYTAKNKWFEVGLKH